VAGGVVGGAARRHGAAHRALGTHEL